MRLSASLWTTVLSASFLALVACGGGGGGGSGSSGGTALLAGRVVLRNGTTSNLGGVRLTFPRTGATVTTASDGSFSFGSVPAGTLTLRVSDPTAGATVARDVAGGGDTSGEDLNDNTTDGGTPSDPNGDGDNNDTGDDDFDVAGVGDGETVDVALSVNDGVIESLDVARSSEDEREAEVGLTRTAESDDPDVTGKVEVESHTDRQRIQIEVEHLDAGRVVRAVLIAPDSTEADLGTTTADGSGEAKWDVDTADGGVLPFGAATVGDLAGDGIEVRAEGGSPVLLTGTMPETPIGAEDGSSTESVGSVELTPASGVTGQAHVTIEHRTGEEARDEISGEVEGVTPGLSIEVWLGDPTSGGTLTKVATVTVDGEGDAEVHVDTSHGDTLPFGVASVADLVGMGVELRNASGGALLFSGAIPPLVGGGD